MNAQKVVGILVAVLVVFWIIDSPASAAGTVNNILADLASAGQSIILFVRQLV